MPNKFVAPMLAVGQIWCFDNAEFAIVRLSKHLAELRGCSSGKVVRRGSADLQSIRAIHGLIKEGRARLCGQVEGVPAGKAGKGPA
jgi:hypothetical protein